MDTSKSMQAAIDNLNATLVENVNLSDVLVRVLILITDLFD